MRGAGNKLLIKAGKMDRLQPGAQPATAVINHVIRQQGLFGKRHLGAQRPPRLFFADPVAGNGSPATGFPVGKNNDDTMKSVLPPGLIQQRYIRQGQRSMQTGNRPLHELQGQGMDQLVHLGAQLIILKNGGTQTLTIKLPAGRKKRPGQEIMQGCPARFALLKKQSAHGVKIKQRQVIMRRPEAADRALAGTDTAGNADQDRFVEPCYGSHRLNPGSVTAGDDIPGNRWNLLHYS